MNASELISCFRAVQGLCAIPLTTLEKGVVTARLLYLSSAIENMLTEWSDIDRCQKAATNLVSPYRALVELLVPRLSETHLRTLSVPIAIERGEFSSAACGRDVADREELKRGWEGIAHATVAVVNPGR